MMGKEERGKLNIFVVSILAPEISHNNKQQNQNRDSYTQTVSGAIALSYPTRVRVRATVKLSAASFHDKSSITIEG